MTTGIRIIGLSSLLLVLGFLSGCGSSSSSTLTPTSTPARVIATIPVGLSPGGIDVNPVTNRIYVADGDGTVSVIDGATNSVVGTVPVGMSASQAVVNPVTNKIYVLTDGQSVTVIDGATNSTTTLAARGGSLGSPADIYEESTRLICKIGAWRWAGASSERSKKVYG